ncbi:MAG TPA: hypothetical protein VJ579_02390 [Candidatus Paceibacterota bacterium]|nr:hypothetical protein [Candidatus Paceibacterota bacterium]
MATLEELQMQINALMKMLEGATPVDFLKRAIDWHNKANIDFFILFMVEYLAFVSLIRQLYRGDGKERSSIQILKAETTVQQHYINQIAKDSVLRGSWLELMNELNDTGLQGDAGWWNNSSRNKFIGVRDDRGNINNQEDWSNMVEVLYQIRNNLFHGTKDPNSIRDQILVRNGYFALRSLVEILIENTPRN